MILNFIAHAGEEHADVVESSRHFLNLNSWILVPLLLLAMAIIPMAIVKFANRKVIAVMVLLVELFFVGVLAFSVLPVLSTISIGAGFLLAFALAFSGLLSTR